MMLAVAMLVAVGLIELRDDARRSFREEKLC